MDSLIFNWDIDIMEDSDGDGDPSNDVDFSGRWIEFTYASGGLKMVKLTVVDDSSSHSVTMDLQVADPPARFSESLISNLIPISIASLILILAVYRFLLGIILKLRNQPRTKNRLIWMQLSTIPSLEKEI